MLCVSLSDGDICKGDHHTKVHIKNNSKEVKEACFALVSGYRRPYPYIRYRTISTKAAV
jgi:hypothetical protein